MGAYQYSSNIIIGGSPAYQQQVAANLDQFLSTQTGQAWLASYTATGHTITIQPTDSTNPSDNCADAKNLDEATTPGVGSDTTIEYNPNSVLWYNAADGSTQLMPSSVILGHEMIHGLDEAKGVDLQNTPDQEYDTAEERQDEVGIEGNDGPTEAGLLAEYGLPARADHSCAAELYQDPSTGQWEAAAWDPQGKWTTWDVDNVQLDANGNPTGFFGDDVPPLPDSGGTTLADATGDAGLNPGLSLGNTGSSSGFSPLDIGAVVGCVALAGLIAFLLTREDDATKGLQQFNYSTLNVNATVSSVPSGTGLNVGGQNLLSPSAPAERTITVAQADLHSSLAPFHDGSSPAAASIIVDNGNGNSPDRMVRIAPMGAGSRGEEVVQVVSVQKGQELQFTSNQAPGASYTSLFHADGSPSAAGINAVNSQRDYLKRTNSDPSWAGTDVGLAASANKNVLAN